MATFAHQRFADFYVHFLSAILAMYSTTFAFTALPGQPPGNRTIIELRHTDLVEDNTVGLAKRAHFPLVRDEDIQSLFHGQSPQVALTETSLCLGRRSESVRCYDDCFVRSDSLRKCYDFFDILDVKGR